MCLPMLMLTACSGSNAASLYDSDQYQTISINESFVPEADEAVTDEDIAVEEAKEEEVKEIDLEELLSHGAGVFSWDHLPNIKDIQCMKDNRITEIYQYLRPEYTDREMLDFLGAMNDVDIEVYILDGEPEWSYEAEYQGMRRVLERVRNLNSQMDEAKAAYEEFLAKYPDHYMADQTRKMLPLIYMSNEEKLAYILEHANDSLLIAQ